MAVCTTPSSQQRTVVDEIPDILRLHSDGSVDRFGSWAPPSIPASREFIHGVASLDVQFDDPSSHLWARIFLPQSISSSPPGALFPVVLHFHGGGMCLGSPSDAPFHSFCSRMAVKSNAIWMSVNYRLAPEHRLPAAYDDAYAALKWLNEQACSAAVQAVDGNGGGRSTGTCLHDWLSHADFARCFVTGESAGGTITHFVAARAAISSRSKDWSSIRLKIRGLMLVHVGFFKDIPTTKPFMEVPMTEHVQLEGFMRLSLPPGAELAGHPYWNPFHQQSPNLSETELPPVLVAVAERDICCEGGVEYYEALKKAGKDVELFMSEGEVHCFHFKEPESAAAMALENRLADFILHK